MPVANLFYFYHSINKLERRVLAAGIRPPIAFWFQARVMNVLDAFWRIPDPYWLILVLSSIFMGTIHVTVAHAEQADAPDYLWPKLHWLEWVCLILGFGLIALALTGAAIAGGISLYIVIGVTTAVIASIVYFYRCSCALSRR